jgi:hypothetical protein
MGLDMGAGAGGAEMLQDVLRRKMVEAQGQRELALREREFQQRAEMQRQQMESLAEARQAAQVAQQAVKAQRVARVLSPGQAVDAATVGALQAGDMGDLVQHQDATLGSRNISGMVQGGKAPRIMGLASTANPGDPASDTFTGTADQLAAKQAREDRQAQLEQGRQDRIAAADKAKQDREEMIRLTASLRTPPQPHTAQPQVFYGADGTAHAIQFGANGATEIPLPAGVVSKAPLKPAADTPEQIEAKAEARARGAATGKQAAHPASILSSVGNYLFGHDDKSASPAVASGAHTIRARDPQGHLHEAAAGTPLPAGWKLEG